VGVEVLRCTVSRSGLGALTRLLRDARLSTITTTLLALTLPQTAGWSILSLVSSYQKFFSLSISRVSEAYIYGPIPDLPNTTSADSVEMQSIGYIHA
jgi:hypothetical protein